VHAELWLADRDGQNTRRVVELPLTDESGPVWSLDGRYLLATSRLPGAETRTLFSAIVIVDLAETPMRARMLRDRANPLARLTPAVLTRLDATLIAQAPEYLSELAKIVAAAVQRDSLAQ
jgi:hypothetical protein